MAVIAEAAHDDALRLLRIREAIVDRQKHLVVLGRENARSSAARSTGGRSRGRRGGDPRGTT